MAAPRTVIRRIVSVAASIGIIAVLHEFGVKYAEQMGWYDNLPAKVEAGMNWLVSLTEPLWFKVVTALLVGFAAGMWVDYLFKRKEFKTERLDREALALEAEQLAKKLFVLASEASAREMVVRDEEWAASRGQGSAFPYRVRSTEVQARTIEKYGEYQFAFQAVLAKTAKCLSLSATEIWRLQHGVHSISEIRDHSLILTKIAIALRHPQPDIPFHHRLHSTQADAIAANHQALLTLPQLPPNTEGKTQP